MKAHEWKFIHSTYNDSDLNVTVMFLVTNGWSVKLSMEMQSENEITEQLFSQPIKIALYIWQ